MATASMRACRLLALAWVAWGSSACSSSDASPGGASDAGTSDAALDGASGDVTQPQDGFSPPDSPTPGDTGGADAAGTDGPALDGAEGGTWWQPGTGVLPWQWEIDHEIVTTSATDMGTGDTTYTGGAAAAPLVYDIDGFDNTAADVSALHALGKKVICYVEVGAAENYRPDYAQFAAADLGATVQGYPTEKYLNIHSAAVVGIIEARITMCAQKGFDGIEPDIDDSYTDTTGFTITEADEVTYLSTLSDYAHSLGVAWGLKNGGDGGDPATFVPDMLPHVDFAVVEEPFFLKTIGFFYPVLYNGGRAMFVAEYTNDTMSSSTFCPMAVADHANAALFAVALNASVRDPCQ